MNKKSLVWDLPLRIFHWLFAVTIFALWYTAEQEGDLIDIHMTLGYVALGLLTFRVIWGIIGPKHARFAQFIPSPNRVINYLKCLKNKQSFYAPGHNPLGALMVILMIVLVSLQAISGLFINDDIFSAGPYYGSLSDEFGKVMSFIHHNIFDYMIIAIALHIGAIIFYWLVKKQNLVLPMITGNKKADEVKEEDKISGSRIVLAIIIAALTAAFIYWLVVLNIPVVEEYYY